MTVEHTTVVSQSDDAATVAVEATIAGELTEGQSQTHELRKQQGEWRIWSIRFDDGGTWEPTTPHVWFNFDYDEGPTSEDDEGVLTITHDGGDAVPAAKLSIRGDGILEVDGADQDDPVPGLSWQAATGDTEAMAGSQVTAVVASDCVVRLVWESNESSTTLTAYRGPDARVDHSSPSANA